MRSIIAVGETAVYFTNYLEKYPDFSFYTLNHTSAEFKVPIYSEMERYEQPLKGLKKYLSTVADDITYVVSGGEHVSLVSLQVLKHIKNKNVDIVYLQPDLDTLNKTGIMLHNLVHGVLQEKTRSHTFKGFTVFDLAEVKKISGTVTLGKMNEAVIHCCAQHWQTHLWLSSLDPVFEIREEKIKNAVISTLSYCDFSLTTTTNLGNLLFTREKEVLLGIPEKRLNEDTNLHNEIMSNFKHYREQEVSTSIKVCGVPFEQEIVYVKSSTTAVQNKMLEETIDKEQNQ